MIIEFLSSLSKKSKVSAIKLAVSLILFITFFIGVLFVQKDLKIFVGPFAVITFFTSILLSIKASKTVRLEMPKDEMTNRFAIILAVPQIICGLILILIGLILPFVEISDLIKDIQSGRSFFLHFIYLVNALLLIVVGYFTVRLGIGFKIFPGKVIKNRNK
ncbi:hypothetical protein [Dyella sp. S184]|uniref:hypothetical protein n=1 Tax=Dyella sp. S184 TaxID=1641862 RepID=UPI00131B4E29|nr:hypothetical protein [Dyella sp. S184]